MVHSADVYELVATVLHGAPTTDRQRARAYSVPVERWERILGLDGCAVQFSRALHRAGVSAELPLRLRRLLRDATASALLQGVRVHAQMTEVAALCADVGLPVMALKGAARLLAGELPGGRSIADIDLLAAPRDAARLHELLQSRLGYAAEGNAYPHHLAGLTRAGSSGIEVHVRLTPTALPLDTEIWNGARQVLLDGHPVELPSATNLLLHTLEHAVRVNWSARYRLRDVLDVAALYCADVDHGRVIAYVAGSDCRGPMRTLLAAARALQPLIPFEQRGAWRTVRRVGRTRLALASLPRTPRVAERLFRYAGVLAEGSPRTIGRAGLGLARRLTVGATAAVR